MPGPTGVILVSRAQLAAENEADWEGEEVQGGSVTEDAPKRDLPAEEFDSGAGVPSRTGVFTANLKKVVRSPDLPHFNLCCPLDSDVQGLPHSDLSCPLNLDVEDGQSTRRPLEEKEEEYQFTPEPERIPTREEEDEYFALCSNARTLITELVSLDIIGPADRVGRVGMFQSLKKIRRLVVVELHDMAGDMIAMGANWPYSKVSRFR